MAGGAEGNGGSGVGGSFCWMCELHNEDDAVYHSGLSGGGQAKYDLQLATDGGNDCPNRLDGNANLPAGTDCVEIKNAGIAGDAMATWASYKLYCL